MMEIATEEIDDDLLEEETIYLVSKRNKVIAWRSWRMSSYHEMRSRVFDMEEEEAFTLRWLNSKKISLTMRFTYISKVYSDKLMEEKIRGRVKKVVEAIEKAIIPLSMEEENRHIEKELKQGIRASLIEHQRPPLPEGETPSNVGATEME